MSAPSEPYRMLLAGKRILVTGGAGFLGRAVVGKLRKRGCAAICIPRRTQWDLSRFEQVRRLFDAERPEIVIHLAASVDNPAGKGDAAASFANNVMMTALLMAESCSRSVEKMVCIGSASSYPAKAPAPLREEDLFNGLPEKSRVAHGVAKRLPLVQAQACREQYGFSCIFLIPTNLYGPGDNFDSNTGYVIPALIRKFRQAVADGATTVALRGSGLATRDFLHVEDCAEGVVLALERYNAPEPANLGSGIETRISDLAKRIADLTGYRGRILWDGSQGDGALRRCLDIARARREFGFDPQRTLESGLRETVEWYQSRCPSNQAEALESRVIGANSA